MRKHVWSGMLGVLALAAMATAVVLWPQRREAAPEDAAPTEATASAAPERVQLTSAKLAAAGIRVAPVARQRIQPIRHVPGRLQYDESNHVAVRTPTDGVLTQVLAQTGDRVTVGQTLATVSSREIGEARADVLRRTEELRLAQIVQQREEEIHANVQELISRLDAHAAFAEIEQQFDGKVLGELGQSLLSAYSQRLLAEEQFTKGEMVGGGLAGAIQRERRSRWEIAKADFRSAIESARFESRQRRDQANLAAEDARRRLDICQQRLLLLTGAPETADDTGSDTFSNLAIVAPVNGTIEQRLFSRTERVTAGDTLFVIADPSTLWVAAAVREKEWEALGLSPGAELIVEPAGAPERRGTARLVYVGREVAPESHSVPLVAALANPDGWLRPGMYATVSLPVGPPVESLAVSPAAVMQHEGERFVFVAEGPQSFRRVRVETGIESDDWIEIRAGLAAGAEVVAQGADLLKSELLLEREAE